jgi:hypothetical protein
MADQVITSREAHQGGNSPSVVYRGTPVFQPISHPVLSRSGEVDIRKFIKARDAYVREVDERKLQEGGDHLVASSLKYSVDPDLLEGLVCLLQFGPEVDTLDKVKDEHISKWLDPFRKGTMDHSTIQQIDGLVSKNLRTKLAEKNPKQRILTLFLDYTSLLRDNGLSWLLESHAKLAVNHITGALRPKALQQCIKRDLELRFVSLKEDWHGFLKHVSSRAEQLDVFDDGAVAETPVKNYPPAGNDSRNNRPAKQNKGFPQLLKSCL